MPWIDRISDSVPRMGEDRRAWLEKWFQEKTVGRIARFWNNRPGPAPKLVEAFEISEYAGKMSPERMSELFPGVG